MGHSIKSNGQAHTTLSNSAKHLIGRTATMLKFGLLLASIMMMAALIEAEAVADTRAEAAPESKPGDYVLVPLDDSFGEDEEDSEPMFRSALPDADAEPQRGLIGFGLGYLVGRAKERGGFRRPYYGRRRPYYGRRRPYRRY